ncbi:MAG: stage II sporulation protein M [Actinomycetales bacterium]
MDLEAFTAVHGQDWDELDALSKRSRLSSDEADRLVTLYQRTATHLSQVRSAAPDPTLISRLSRTLARARGRLTGASESWWRDAVRYFTISAPAALYRIRWLTLAVAIAFTVIALGYGWWVVANPDVQAALLTDSQTRQLVDHDFENYYSEYAATSFAARVWTNNAWIAASCVAFGITGVYPVQALYANAQSIGMVGGIMVANGAADKFFGLITPHGLLELTAVFTAIAAGLRLFWVLVEPGPRTRTQALGEQGRALFTVAGALVVVLFVSGIVEAFVTPSPLPTWARIAIGVVVWLAYLGYCWWFGRRAVAAGEIGDLSADQVGDYRPVSG